MLKTMQIKTLNFTMIHVSFWFGTAISNMYCYANLHHEKAIKIILNVCIIRLLKTLASDLTLKIKYFIVFQINQPPITSLRHKHII